MQWNPDDIVLTIDAFQRIRRTPSERANIIATLAGELRRKERATDAAVEAVGVRPMQSQVALVLIETLRNNELETQRLARVIRKLRGRW